MPGSSDGLFCDSGIPIGLDLQYSHLQCTHPKGEDVHSSPIIDFAILWWEKVQVSEFLPFSSYRAPEIIRKCIGEDAVPHRADLDEAIVLNEDGVTGQVPVDDGGTAGVQKTECRQDLRTPALPGLAADARLRRVGTKRLLSLRSPPATPLLNRGLSESPAPPLSLSSAGLPPVPSPLPIPGRSWPCGSSWSF